MITNAPDTIDVQDLQFKLHCRLKIFDKVVETRQLSQCCNLLACASRFGLIFAGTFSSNFQVILLKDLEQYEKADGDKSDYPRRTVTLASPPKYLSINCEHTILAVIIEKDTCPWAIFYDIKSFFSINPIQLVDVRLSSTPGVNVVDVSWNPTLAHIFTACKSDGSLGNYELKNPGIDINELPAQAGATCFCWSPKGKQIAVGSKDGRITQYKPDLKAVKVINSPPLKALNTLMSLQWVSNYQFIGIFQSADNLASLIVIDAPKTGNIVFTNYEDICYSSGNVRLPQFYMILIQHWNILMVASSNSMEVGVLGGVGEKWTQWTIGDAARAELPLSADHQETLPVGFALDIGSIKPLSWGEGALPPTPYLLLLSHFGTLCCFNVVNLKENIPSVTSPAEIVADAGGLKSFIVPNKVGKQAATVQAIIPPPIQTQNVPLFGAAAVQSSNVFGFNSKETTKAATPSSSGLSLFTQTIGQTIPPAVTQISTKFTTNNESTNSKQIPKVPSSEFTASKFVEDKAEAATLKAEEEEETLLAQLIKEECIFLESELKTVFHQSYKVSIGSDADKSALVSKTVQLIDFFKEVVDNCSTQNAEVHCLCQNVMQSWAWYEEAKSRYKAFDDESINLVLRSQPLDLPSEKQLGDIQHASYYLESQMAQAHRALDEQWDNFQDYCKKTHKIQMPTMEAIFQTMVKQYGILQKQSYIMKDITRRIKTEARSSLGPSLLVSISDKKELDQEMKMLRLEPEDIRQIQHVHVLNRTKNFTEKKQDKLRVFWKSQQYKQISVCKSQLSTSVLQSTTMKPSSTKQFSILGAKMSPVSKKDAGISRKIDFLQSTPKPEPKFDSKPNNAIEGLQNFTMKFESSNFKNVGAVKNVTTIASSPNSAFVSTSLGISSAPTPTVFSSKSLTSLTKPMSVPATTTTTTSSFFAQNQPIISISATNVSKPFSFGPFTTSSSEEALKTSSPSIFITSTPTPTVKPFNFNVASSPSIFGVSEDKSSSTKPEIVYSTPPPSAVLNLTTSTKPASTTAATTGSLFAFTTTTTSSSTSSAPASKPFSFASLAGNTAISITPLPKPAAKVTSAPLNLSQPLNLISESGSVAQTVSSAAAVDVTKTPVILSVPSSETVQAAVKPSIFGSIASSTGSIFDNPSTTSGRSATTTSSSIFGSIPSSLPVSQFVPSSSIFSSSAATLQSSSIFGGGATTTTSTSVFGKSSSMFKSPSTVTTTAAESSVFAVKSTTQSLIFGGNNTVSTAAAPIFGSVSSSSTSSTTSAQSIFDNSSASVTSSQSLFGTLAATAATKPSIFGSFTPSSTTQTSSVFGGAAAAAATSTTTPTTQSLIFGASGVFGATSTTSGAPSASQTFGSFTSSAQQKPASIFGSSFGGAAAATTQSLSTSSSIFGGVAVADGTITTTQSSVFGKTSSSVFAASNAPATTSVFGAGSFGTPSSANSSTTFGQTPSVFGGASGNVEAFGSSSFGSAAFGSNSNSFGQTTQSVFGTPTTTTSAGIFGGGTAATTSSFGAFGAPSTGFSSPATATQSTGFGGTSAGSFGFGGLNVGAAPTSSTEGGFSGGGGTAAVNPFGGSTTQKTVFGTDSNTNKSIFGGATGAGASSSGSIFGSAPSSNSNTVFGRGNNQSSSTFGGSASSPVVGQQSIFGKSSFGQSSGFGGFGSQSAPSAGPFSANAGSVSQSGFGASPSFQKPAAAAAASPSAGFGAAPVFGSSSSFGSAPSFGGAPAFGTSSAFGSPQKVFGSAGNNGNTGGFGSPILASNNAQNTVFSNLANQPTVGFGNLAQQASTPPPSSNNSFSGGSSFSSWR